MLALGEHTSQLSTTTPSLPFGPRMTAPERASCACGVDIERSTDNARARVVGLRQFHRSGEPAPADIVERGSFHCCAEPIRYRRTNSRRDRSLRQRTRFDGTIAARPRGTTGLGRRRNHRLVDGSDRSRGGRGPLRAPLNGRRMRRQLSAREGVPRRPSRRIADHGPAPRLSNLRRYIAASDVLGANGSVVRDVTGGADPARGR
jgi:hypothetical protein